MALDRIYLQSSTYKLSGAYSWIKSGGYCCSSVKHEIANNLLHGYDKNRDISNSVQIFLLYTCNRN